MNRMDVIILASLLLPVSHISGTLSFVCDCDKLEDVNLNCPFYNSSDWNCHAKCFDCQNGLTYHCAKNNDSPLVEDYIYKDETFSEGCAVEKICRKGEEPQLTFIFNQQQVENPVVYCKKCLNKNKYNPFDDQRSSTYSQCSVDKINICKTDYNKIDCRPRDTDSSTDRYCRCDAKNGFRPDVPAEGQKCSYQNWICEKDKECSMKGYDLLLNYTCGKPCSADEKRADDDECYEVRVTTSSPEPAIEQTTKKITNKTTEKTTDKTTDRSEVSTRKTTQQAKQPSIDEPGINWSDYKVWLIIIGVGIVVVLVVAGGVYIYIRKRNEHVNCCLGYNCCYHLCGQEHGNSGNQKNSSTYVTYNVNRDFITKPDTVIQNSENRNVLHSKSSDSDTETDGTASVTNADDGNVFNSEDNMNSFDTDRPSEGEPLLHSKESYYHSASETGHNDPRDKTSISSDQLCTVVDETNVDSIKSATASQSKIQNVDTEEDAAEVLQTISQSKDIEIIEKICKGIRKPEMYQKEVDSASLQAVYYENCPGGYEAYKISGKNNGCLFQAISILLTGTEIFQDRLRLLATLCAVDHFEDYVTQLIKYNRDDLERFFDDNLIELDFANQLKHMDKKRFIEECFQQLIKEMARIGIDSSPQNACLLQAAVNREIYQYFQDDSHPRLKDRTVSLDVKYDKHKSAFHIFWVKSAKDKKNMDHVVPLMLNPSEAVGRDQHQYS